MKQCAYCGAELRRRHGESSRNYETRRYCSVACRNRGYVKHGYRAWKSGRCDCDTCATAFQAAEAKRREQQRHARRVLSLVLVDVWQPPAHLFLPCTQDPDAWHPDPVVSISRDKAAAMCAGCEVQADCYLAGVNQHETGVWGGVRLINGRPAGGGNNR